MDTVEEFVQRFDTDVHRSQDAQRPYWKMGPMKQVTRVRAKAAKDYSQLERPHTSHVLDLVRCTAYFDDPLTLALCYAILTSLVEIVRVKNRFVEPAPFGYRDILLNVRLANGHIAEIQFGFDSLMLLKEWMHPNYSLARTAEDSELILVCRNNINAAPQHAPFAVMFGNPELDEGDVPAGQEVIVQVT